MVADQLQLFIDCKYVSVRPYKSTIDDFPFISLSVVQMNAEHEVEWLGCVMRRVWVGMDG